MRRQLQPSEDALRQVELFSLAQGALARRRGALVACGEVTRNDVNRLSNLAQVGWATAAFTATGERLEDPVRRLVIEHQQRGYWCEAHDIDTLAEVLPAEPYPTGIAFLHLKGDRLRELTACLERLEPLLDVGATVVLEDGGSAREAIARLAEARGLVPAAVVHDALFCWRRPGGDDIDGKEDDGTEREEGAADDPRLDSGQFTILAYPQPPTGKFALLCKLGGFRVVSDLTRPFDLAIKWFGEMTYTPNDRGLDELSQITSVVNLGCCDISKRRVEEVHREIFGYGLMVDPHTYDGPCVKKANLNAQVSESLVQCPLTPDSSDGHSGGFVYQRLVVTPREPDEYEEYRVPVTGGEIPCVVIKRRPLSERFDRCAGYAVFAEFDEVFSATERSQIRELCRVFGLEFGDLDILRERDDGRLHVIDVNPTPGSPGAAGYGYTEEQRQDLLRRELASFRKAFIDRLGDDQGSVGSQRDRS